MLQLIKTNLFVDAAAAKQKDHSTGNNLYFELIRHGVWYSITVLAFAEKER